MTGRGARGSPPPMRTSGTLLTAAMMLLTVLVALPAVAPAAPVSPSTDRTAVEAPVATLPTAAAEGYHFTGTPSPSALVTTTVTLSNLTEAATLRAYLAGHGLGIDGPAGMTVWLVTGTTAAFDGAFATSLESFTGPNGVPTLAFATAPSVPRGVPVAAVAPPDGTMGFQDALERASPTGPQVSDSSCPPDYQGTLNATQVETAYNITPAYAQGLKGAGETIGIVDAYDSAEPANRVVSDLAHFSTCSHLSAADLAIAYPIPGQNLNTTPSSGWGLETALDTEWAHATAPAARILLALAPNSAYGLYFSVDWLIATQSVDVVSLSWGEPETGIYNFGPCSYQCNASSDGSLATLGPVFAQAAAEGIDVFVASGDCGANGGTRTFTPWYPASDPHTVGVGGTVLHLSPTGGYGTEYAWNGTQSLCFNGGGTGGGFSQLPRPWWQYGPGFGRFTNSTRGAPDVALTSDVPLGIVYNGSPVFVMGTSDAAPQWAGMGALIAEALGTSTPGFLPPTLYRILRTPAYSQDFHEVLEGTNGYVAGPGWDPLTGIGTPDFANLLATLRSASPGRLATEGSLTLSARPLAGVAPAPWIPLPSQLSVTPWNGTAAPTQYQFYLGDVGSPYQESNSTTTNQSWTSAEYTLPGAYVAYAVGYGPGGNTSISNPLVINVGNAGPLGVSLAAQPSHPVAGQPVTFTASETGGSPAYHYAYYFGDGTYQANWNAEGPLTSHTYSSNGTYLVTAVVNDSSVPLRGGWATACVVVGNSSTPCPVVPRTLVVSLDPTRSTLAAGSGSNGVNVTVTYNGAPVGGARVNLSAPRGTFAVGNGTTDTAGTFATSYVAPNLGESLEYPLYANVTAPGFAPGEGESLIIVNPVTGPSIVPAVTLAQTSVLSGGSDGVLIATQEAVTQAIIPGTMVNLSTSLGTVSPAAEMVNGDGLLTAELFVPTVTTTQTGTVTATASVAGHTSDTTVNSFTIVPGTGATRLHLTLNYTTVPSMASTGLDIHLANPDESPRTLPIGGIHGWATAGSFSDWALPAPGHYTAAYSSPATFTNDTEVLVINATGKTPTDVIGSTDTLVNVTWGHGRLALALTTGPTEPLLPKENGTIVVTVVSALAPQFPLSGALVVVNLELGKLRGQNVAWTDAWGRVAFNYTAPNFTGRVPVAVLVIGFAYPVANENFTFDVNVPSNEPAFPADMLYVVPTLALGVALAAVAVERGRPARTSPPAPPAHPTPASLPAPPPSEETPSGGTSGST